MLTKILNDEGMITRRTVETRHALDCETINKQVPDPHRFYGKSICKPTINASAFDKS